VSDRLEDKIKQFVIENFLYGEPEETLTEELSFLDSGIMDSSRVLELILYIEETFDIKVEDDELTPANLDSVKAVAAYVRSKTGVLA